MTDNKINAVGEDKLHVGFIILSFFIPIVAAVLYFMNKEQYPNKAKSAMFAGLAGLIAAIVIQFVFLNSEGI